MSSRKTERKFLELAELFRETTDPQKAKRLGDKLGRMIFGGQGRSQKSP